MAAENDTWTRGDMVERLRLNDKGITDFGEVPQVPPLRNYRELQNNDVMQVFRLYGGSAVPLIKQLVPLLREVGPRDITKKYKDGSRKHTLVERRKKAHRSTENFKAEGFVQHYFGHIKKRRRACPQYPVGQRMGGLERPSRPPLSRGSPVRRTAYFTQAAPVVC